MAAQNDSSTNAPLVVTQGGGAMGYVIIFIALAALFGGAYALYQYFMAPTVPPAKTGSTGATPAASSGGIVSTVTTAVSNLLSGTPAATPAASVFPLHSGSRGPEVMALQKYLNSTYNISPQLATDGIWGSGTNAAMQKYAGTTSVSQAEYNNMVNAAQNATADVPASSSMGDGTTDFTNSASAPWPAWQADQGGFSVGDRPVIYAGANFTLYDSNLKVIGSMVNNTDNTPQEAKGTIWGLQPNASFAIIQVDEAYTDNQTCASSDCGYKGATFIGVPFSGLCTHTTLTALC